MIPPQPQDTPIKLVSIAHMDDKQLVDVVSNLQERRLRGWNIYQAGLAAKAQTKHDKDVILLDKACEKFLKQHASVEKALEKLDKYAIDIQALRLTVGG